MLGNTYEFTVEARNNDGYSPASDSVTIFHAMPPEQPISPSTSNSGTEIVIDWEAPYNNGAVISSYTITIQQSDGIYSEDTVNCDGF